MSQSEIQSNIDTKNANNEINMDPHSKYEELIGNYQCQLTDEIYPPQNEEDTNNKNFDHDNQSEADDKKSTKIDSVISEKEKNPNPKPIKIAIKNSTEEDKIISKNNSEININLSDNEDNFLQNYLDQINEPKLESPSESQSSESSNKEVTFKIKLNKEINCNSNPNLLGKKTKRKWEQQAKSEISKKNKIKDFIRTFLELVKYKNNNIAEDEDGDRLNIRENNFPEVCCNQKFYGSGYSPHIIELSESLTRYHVSFGNDWQTISTKSNSLEANGY